MVDEASVIDLFPLYQVLLEQERQVLTALNMLKPEGNLLFGFCWVPQRDFSKVKAALRNVHNSDPLNYERPRLYKLNADDYRAEITPPTHLPTTEFTWTF